MKMFTKSTKRSELLSERECHDLAERITELTDRLCDVHANFDIVTDECAIDALIYEENALLCRIEALHHEARERGISIQPFQR